MSFQWIVLKRGDSLPKNAVYAGVTAVDGKMYVAKMDNSPGKVNLKDGKIWNFWSQNYNSRQESEVLVVNGKCIWKEINQGDLIPENAVHVGYDYNLHKVWVGKDITTDEPGKITCIDSDDEKPKMCKLWCHSYTRFANVQKASILLLEPEPPQKINENCMWGNTIKYGSYEEKIKCRSLDISINKLVSAIVASIAVAAGELTHLTEILKTNINLHISDSNFRNFVISKSVINTHDQKYYIMLKYEKKTLERNTILGGIFNYHNLDFYLNVKYAILEPINESARLKCINHTEVFVNNIYNDFWD